MKNILKLITVSALSASLFSSCIEEVMPTNGAIYDQVKDRVDAMVAGIPGAMLQISFAGTGEHNDFGYPSLIIARESMGEDFVHGGNFGADWFYDYADNYSWGYTYGLAGHFWNSYWPWVKGCNDVLRAVKETNGDPSYMGVAYAFRAFFYLDMVRLYEFKENKYTDGSEVIGLAVPIITEETTEEMAANNPRATVDEVYELIFSDLENAEKYLASYSRPNAMMPNLAVVYGLYARAYLERGKKDSQNYAKAAEYARKAIDASGCTPLTENEWFNGFNSVSTQNSWMWALIQTSEEVSNLMNFVAYMSNEQDFGYGQCGNGVSFCISTNLYNQIPTNDFRKYTWLDPKGDRFHYYQITYPDRDKFMELTTPYANIKFKTANGETVSPKTGAATDIPLMRVEEMYLIEAEAAGKANLAEGKRLLNEFMKYRNPSYDCSSVASFEAFQRAVILQKRIEFWGEGIILFDYMRLRLGLNRGYEGSNFTGNHTYNCEEIAPWWNLCIPRSEIQNNRGIPQTKNNPDPSGTV